LASKEGAMNSPEGRSTLDLETAAAISSLVTCRDCALSGSTTTLICRSRPPSGAALATPEIPSSNGSMLLNA
jgi:hypothetical protein